ncbi:MAG: EAL domain-containing protein [Cyanobacteria bacterium P01_G01_bin.67]
MSKILVVEDDPLTLSSVKDLLEAENFQVIGAEDGEIALEIIEENAFDLIVCDLFLPKVNGYEILSSMRKNIDTAKIPFIVLSGRNKRRDVALGMEIGVSDYITKPFLNEELINSIQEQLKKKQFLENCYQKLDSNLDQTKTPTLPKAPQKKNPLYYDHDTNLANQFYLREQFDRIVSNYVTERIKLGSSGVKKKAASIAVCCISLGSSEDFINDLDQEQINSILKSASQRLNNRLGNKSKIMRLEEGYLVMILPYITQFNRALQLVKTAQESLVQPFTVKSQTLYLKPRIGISFYPQHGQEIAVLLERAKQALEKAQQNSEDFYEVYRPHLSYSVKYKSLALVDDLRNALNNQELEIHYQPQVDLLTGKVTIGEALIVWHHPQRGYIPSATFMPIAEDIGLIKSIETWFLFTICRQLRHWHKLGFKQLKLAFNLTGHRFSAANLNPLIATIINQTHLKPESLIVELDESLLFRDGKVLMDEICDLKSLGIQVALDNFGRGYSSLSYLQQFPINILKVDLYYLANIVGEKNMPVALRYIFKTAFRAKIKVTAVNVATKEQLNFLRQHQVESAQGDFLSLRLLPNEFEELLQGKSDWLATLFSFPPM